MMGDEEEKPKLLDSTMSTEQTVGESDPLLEEDRALPEWARHTGHTVLRDYCCHRVTIVTAIVLLVLSVSVALYIWISRAAIPLEFRELRQACRANDWRDGLFINATLQMGLNNLRAEFATLHKWAFDAGAGLILPGIWFRNNDTLDAFAPSLRVRADDVFNVDALRRRLAVYCPEMRLSDGSEMNDVVTRDWEPPRAPFGLVYSRGQYRQYVDERLFRHSIKWSPGVNVIVADDIVPLVNWAYHSDTVDFNMAWFDLLEWAPRLRALSQALGRSTQLQGGYIGVHLRVERTHIHIAHHGIDHAESVCIGDTPESWPTFDQQADAYAFWLQQRPEKVIFLACGDSAYEKQFQERFPDHTVLTKWDLARDHAHLTSALSELTFDEIAAVDYDLLKEANFVMGIGLSSFAYALGVDRRVDRTSRFSLLMQNDSSLYLVSTLWRAPAEMLSQFRKIFVDRPPWWAMQGLASYRRCGSNFMK